MQVAQTCCLHALVFYTMKGAKMSIKTLYVLKRPCTVAECMRDGKPRDAWSTAFTSDGRSDIFTSKRAALRAFAARSGAWVLERSNNVDNVVIASNVADQPVGHRWVA